MLQCRPGPEKDKEGARRSGEKLLRSDGEGALQRYEKSWREVDGLKRFRKQNPQDLVRQTRFWKGDREELTSGFPTPS